MAPNAEDYAAPDRWLELALNTLEGGESVEEACEKIASFLEANRAQINNEELVSALREEYRAYEAAVIAVETAILAKRSAIISSVALAIAEGDINAWTKRKHELDALARNARGSRQYVKRALETNRFFNWL